MYDTSKQRLRRIIADAALRLKRDAGDLREEGMEFLIFAREWTLLNQFNLAEIAVKNAVSVLRPLWKVEVMRPARR